MNQLYRLLLPCLLWLLGQTANAQTIVPVSLNTRVCAGSAVSVSFTTSGTFAVDNTFQVELTSGYDAPVVSLPTSVSGNGTLTFGVPASATEGEFYRYRIRSTKPAIVSEWSNLTFAVVRLPTARLLGSTADSLPTNPYTKSDLQIDCTGGVPYTLTMQDSSRFIKYYNGRLSGEFPVTPAQTTTYRIASVRNVCGLGTVSGSTTIRINPVGIQLTEPTGDVCLGKVLPIYFSTSAPLPANTRFSAELVVDRQAVPPIALSVSGTTSPLRIELPVSLPQNEGRRYRLRIYSEQVGLSVWYLQGDSFGIPAAPPRLSLSGPRETIPTGPTTLTISYTNARGWVTLSTGERINVYGSGSQTVPVELTAPTTYSLVGYAGACYDTAAYAVRAVRIAPTTGVRIDSLSRADICLGQSVSLYYTAPAGYVMPERLRLRGGELPGDLPVTMVRPGELSFKPISQDWPSDPVQLIDADTGLPIAQFRQRLGIRILPSVELVTSSAVELAEPGEARLAIKSINTSGLPTRLTLNTGEEFTLERMPVYSSYVAVYVTQSTTYSVVSIVNECGSGRAEGSQSIQVQKSASNKPGVYLRAGWLTEPESKSFAGYTELCPGSIKHVFLTPTGTFAADNQFRLELSDETGVYPTSPARVTTQPGSLTFNWPSRTGTVRIRVSTTNPVTVSNELVIRNQYVYPKAELTLLNVPGSRTAEAYTVVSGQPITLGYTVSGGISPTRYEWLDGTKGLASLEPGYGKVIRPVASGFYGFRSVTDGCGIRATPPVRKYITVVPSLLVADFVPGLVCAGQPIEMPIRQLGSAPVSSSYIVQVSTDRINWQTVPTSGTLNKLTVVFPQSLANQTILYRVASVDNGVVQPGAVRSLVVAGPPDVLLSGPNQAELVGTSMYESASLEWKDASPSTSTLLIRYPSGQVNATVPFYGARQINGISTPGTYSVVAAYNQCGYGSIRGAVEVVRRPTLTQFITNRKGYCAGETVSVQYAVQDLMPGNTVSLYLTDATTTRTLLTQTSVATGTFAFPLSSTMAPGSYSLVYASALQPQLPQEPLGQAATFTVQSPLSLTLGSIQRVVYAETVVSLPLTGDISGPYALTLSTPGGLSVLAGSANSVLTLPRAETGMYTLAGATNQCGAGRVAGTASLTVLPASSVTIQPEGTAAPDLLCTGKVYTLPITTSGSFGATNVFTAYLIGPVGGTRRAVPTTGRGNSLTVTIPADVPADSGYLLRVGSSEPEHLGASLIRPLAIQPTPTATLTGNASIVKGDSVRLSIGLTGAAPWQLILAEGRVLRSFIATQPTYTISVHPDSTGSYQLREVRNAECGLGTVSGVAQITVSPLLATEPALALQVRVWPNPTSGQIRLQGELPTHSAVQMRLYSLLGALVQQRTSPVPGGRLSEALDLSGLPAGLYLLSVEQDGRRRQYKLLKQ